MGHSSRRPAVFVRCLIVLFAALTASHAASPELPPLPAWSRNTLSGLRYKAVLIAGDWSSPAFDHATEAMRDRLRAALVTEAGIQRLSASRAVAAQNDVRSSSLDHVLSAVARLHPDPGQGCLVFATSHGAYGEGLVLVPSDNFLTPEALDKALIGGCGDAPTAVIISGCFSGGFARPPMARANRIILTAAREDRSSFGCDARSQYTFYDRCLLRAMDSADTWRAAYTTIRACVAKREHALRFKPSEPQAFFGEAVEEMPVPRRP
jgi:Peptidase C13 family